MKGKKSRNRRRDKRPRKKLCKPPPFSGPTYRPTSLPIGQMGEQEAAERGDEIMGELDTQGVEYLRPTGMPRRHARSCRCCVCRTGT